MKLQHHRCRMHAHIGVTKISTDKQQGRIERPRQPVSQRHSLIGADVELAFHLLKLA